MLSTTGDSVVYHYDLSVRWLKCASMVSWKVGLHHSRGYLVDPRTLEAESELWSDWSIRIWKSSCQQCRRIARKAQNMGIWWLCPNAACWPWPTYTNRKLKYEDVFKRTDSNTTSQQKMHFSKDAFRIPSLIYGTPSTRQRQDIRPRSVFPAIIAGLVESQLATTGRVRYTDPIALQRHGWNTWSLAELTAR